ncbi:MAG: hypothetical protein K6U00_11435 [Armatimonadetes bacterium]|nr:hypothetical protein [Armatimonadota bacterium]
MLNLVSLLFGWQVVASPRLDLEAGLAESMVAALGVSAVALQRAWSDTQSVSERQG